MPSLTIGGQAYTIRLTPRAVSEGEDHWTHHGGRPLLEILATPNGGADPKRGVFFRISELEGLCWGAWHRQFGADRPGQLLEQYYAEGGTLWELHSVVVDALVDGGLLGRRAPPPDPSTAGGSAGSGTSSPS